MAAGEHQIRWFARVSACEEAPDGHLPRTRYMVASSFGWDAICSCGWHSHTGGATESFVKRAIASHKWDIENGFDERS